MASNDEQRSATTIFTTAAQSIAARLIANKTTSKFTKAEISTTNLFNQSVTELQVLTSLDNVQQTADINTVTVINDSTVDVNIVIDQTKAPNDYQMNSVGLYAKDGDGKEILYSVTVLKDPVYIHQDAMGSALGIDLETVVGQSNNVDLSINPAGAVTNEALKVTLADYVKTDDVKSLIPDTVIDGSKPADFKEPVTLEKGAVDGAGNAIATTKNVADGDAATLKTAKDYVALLTVGETHEGADLNNETSAGTYMSSSAVINGPFSPATYVGWKVVTSTDNVVHQTAFKQTGELSQRTYWKGSGWGAWNDVPRSENVVHRDPNTGVVSEPVDLTNAKANGHPIVPIETSTDKNTAQADSATTPNVIYYIRR